MHVGVLSGTLKVSLQLDHQITLRLAKREKSSKERSQCTYYLSCVYLLHGVHVHCIAVKTAPIKPLLETQRSEDRTCQVEHLPPFSLYFQLPKSYPSSSKPDYTLICQWLNFTQVCFTTWTSFIIKAECLTVHNIMSFVHLAVTTVQVSGSNVGWQCGECCAL